MAGSPAICLRRPVIQRANGAAALSAPASRGLGSPSAVTPADTTPVISASETAGLRTTAPGGVSSRVERRPRLGLGFSALLNLPGTNCVFEDPRPAREGAEAVEEEAELVVLEDVVNSVRGNAKMTPPYPQRSASPRSAFDQPAGFVRGL